MMSVDVYPKEQDDLKPEDDVKLMTEEDQVRVNSRLTQQKQSPTNEPEQFNPH